MKAHELALDKERKEKLGTTRVHGCAICHATHGVTLYRYGKGYICKVCIDKKERGEPAGVPVVISPVEQVGKHISDAVNNTKMDR